MSDEEYVALLEQVRRLDPIQMQRLRDGITALIEEPIADEQPFDIMDLEGLGQEVWEGIDGGEDARKEREAWGGAGSRSLRAPSFGLR